LGEAGRWGAAVAPLGWCDAPSPPVGEDERRRGVRKMKWLAAGYVAWLVGLVAVGLVAVGAFGRWG